MPVKELIVVAGPNGTGKTTFAKQFVRQFDYEFVNADEIAGELNPADTDGVRIRAGKLFLQRVNKKLGLFDSFIIESTLAGKYLKAILERAKREGFKIRIVFVFLDGPEQSIERIQVRVRRGGHFVPDHIVRRRYNRSLQNFWYSYRFLADEWRIFNNAHESSVEVVVGENTQYSVINDELFRDFLTVAGS